jgi:hypothetical protein
VVVRVAPFVGIAGAHRAGSRALHLIQDRSAPVVGAGRLAIIAPTMSTSPK